MASATVDSKIAGRKVVVFSKSTCTFCIKVKALLEEYNLSAEDLEVVDMDKAPYDSEDMSDMLDYLLEKTGARTVPRVFVGGKSVGGCDDTQAAHRNGSLKKMIEA